MIGSVLISIAIIVLVVVAIWISFFLYVVWGTHLSMTRLEEERRNQRAEWLTFRQFLLLFRSRKWAVRETLPGSFFAAETDVHNIFDQNSIHAGTIFIDGQVYKMRPVDYWRFRRWKSFIYSVAQHHELDNIRHGTLYHDQILN